MCLSKISFPRKNDFSKISSSTGYYIWHLGGTLGVLVGEVGVLGGGATPATKTKAVLLTGPVQRSLPLLYQAS